MKLEEITKFSLNKASGLDIMLYYALKNLVKDHKMPRRETLTKALNCSLRSIS